MEFSLLFIYVLAYPCFLPLYFVGTLCLVLFLLWIGLYFFLLTLPFFDEFEGLTATITKF
jgi:hypothetical protein